MNILVTDGENRSALAVTRSLGRGGMDVFVSGSNIGNISASSKFCKRKFDVPNPLNEGSKYNDRILEIVKKENIDIVFPMTEQSIYQLNRIRDQFSENVILACQCYKKMETVSNKFKLFSLAQNLGIPIPKTTFVEGPGDFSEKISQINRFPAVVKPAFSKILNGDRMIPTSVMYAADRGELNSLYESKTELRYPSLIQELIIGQGSGLFTLFDEDHHLVLFSHQRLLEKPPSGGISVISESIQLDCEMVKAAEKLLSAVGWKGVAMVEFKRDVRDGKAKLMEINGRFWGSLQLAISSGIDFPLLYLGYCLGKKPTSLLDDYCIGHRLKWFFGILDHAIIRIKNGDRMLERPFEIPTRWQVAKELLVRSTKNTSFDVYDADDWRPFVQEIKAYLQNIIT